MDSLLCAFSSLSVSVVKNDVMIICESYTAMLPELEKTTLLIKKGMFESTQHLYKEVLSVLSEINRSEHLIDLMPYIDDYLEYYETL